MILDPAPGRDPGPINHQVGETGASCYTGKLLQSKYLALWCIDGVANV